MRPKVRKPEVNIIEVSTSEKTDTAELAEVSLTRFVGYFLRLGTLALVVRLRSLGICSRTWLRSVTGSASKTTSRVLHWHSWHLDLWPRNSQFILVMSVTEFLAPPPSPLRLSYLHS